MNPCSFVSLFALCCLHVSAWTRPKQHNRTVDVDELEDVFTSMNQRAAVGDLEISGIQEAMQSTYNVLPKNEFQRLSHSAVTYLVHDYFAQKHQWHFRGFGAEREEMMRRISALASSQDTDITVPQEMAPRLVEEMLQAQESGHGLTLSDAAAMAATLKRLVLNDVEVILMKAYELRGFPLEVPLRTSQIVELLNTFAFVEHGKQPIDDLERRLSRPSYFMHDFTEHFINILGTMSYNQRPRINPFKARHYSFELMLDVIQRALETFGEYQAGTCIGMKNHLITLDPSGAGRVPLGVFYTQPDMHSYRFQESEDYLKEIGALDDSVANRPEVLISNYVLGQANCYSSSTYFQFCCVNNCMRLMDEIETYIAGSEATPEELTDGVGNASERVSLDLAEQAQEITDELREKLTYVAQKHGGKVPLHGRLFAQWLHFAFPRECPYPHVPKQGTNNDPLTANDFMLASADPSEIQRHIEATGGAGNASARTLSLWTDDEMLWLVSPPRRSSSAFVRIALRMLAVFLALSATVVTLFRGSRRADLCRDYLQEDFHKVDKLV